MAISKYGNSGFTLIELMVVVAIIAILGTIVMPNFQKYSERAHYVEAKGGLTKLYIAEQAWLADNASYSICVKEIGFDVDGPSRYYTVGWGFLGDSQMTCGPYGTSQCSSYVYLNSPGGDTHCLEPDEAVYATRAASATFAAGWWFPGFGNADYGTMTASTFLAEARGSVSPFVVAESIWTIDQNKVLIDLGNTPNGLF